MWSPETPATLTITEKYYISLQYCVIFSQKKTTPNPAQADFSCTIAIDIDGSKLPKTPICLGSFFGLFVVFF